GEIVLGKLAARSLNILVVLALGLPIVVMLSLFGGVDPNGVLLFFAASASTAFFLAAVSILVSTHARKPRDAILTVYIIELLWLFARSLIDWLFPRFGGGWAGVHALLKPVLDWVGASGPLYVMNSLSRIGGGGPVAVYELVLWMIGLQVAY